MPDTLQPRQRASTSPPQVPPAGTPGATSLKGIVVAVLIVVALYLGREVLMPVTLAM
jgi:hypothetical protein